MIVVWLQHDCYCEIVTSWLKHDSCFIPCRQKPSIRSIPFPEPRRRKAKNDPTTERGKGSRRAGCTLKPITWTPYPRAHGLKEREKKGKRSWRWKKFRTRWIDGSMDWWIDRPKQTKSVAHLRWSLGDTSRPANCRLFSPLFSARETRLPECTCRLWVSVERNYRRYYDKVYNRKYERRHF